MNYQEATTFLFELENSGFKLGLERMHEFLGALGNPQHHFKSVHIAGTNGKGSTSAFLESILRASGVRTGLYTSPHLVHVEERIKINGENIHRDEFMDYFIRVVPFVKSYQTTFFESLTGLAFLYFAEKQVEIAVLEVGLGGRLDATNVVRPLLTLITSISYDHQHILGDTLEAIAREKAGIVKNGIPCLASNDDEAILDVLRQKCEELGSEFWPLRDHATITNKELSAFGGRFDLDFLGTRIEHLQVPLAGEHQVLNATLAVCAALKLEKDGAPISIQSIRTGLENARWPGRLQVVRENPRVLIDVAHNLQGISALVTALKTLHQFERAIILFGVMKDKDYPMMLKILSTIADDLIVVAPAYKRSLPRDELSAAARKAIQKVAERASVADAYELALSQASARDLICITGSHFTVGEFISEQNCQKYGLNL